MTNTSRREIRFDQVQLLREITVSRCVTAESLELDGKGEEAARVRREADIWLSIQRRYSALS